MDERGREERYYDFLWKKSVLTLSSVGAFYVLVLLIVWDPIKYGDIFNYGVVVILGIFGILIVLGKESEKRSRYGFWTSMDGEARNQQRTLLYLSLMIAITGLVFSWMFAVKFSWNLLVSDLPALIIVIIASGPGIYFIRKKRFQLIKRKYGRNRLTYFKGEVGDKKEIITTTLDRMKVKYTEQDESSKLQGPKKCFLLPETGMKIYYTAYDLPSGAIIITNIPDDDTLEKQIEDEILRRISG